MVYTVLYKTSSFAGYCFLDKNSIHPKGYGVFSFKAFKAVLVKIQICSFIVIYFNGALTLKLFQYCHEYCRKDRAVLIWRPHPYDFDTPQAREQIEKLRDEKNIIIDTNQSYDAAFNISDTLITIFCSSILVNYLFTDKPVLILDKGYFDLKDNQIDFQDEAWYKASYTTNDEDTGRKFVDMILEGRDDKKAEKLPYRKFMQQGFDGKVCERIASFADEAYR